MTWQVEATKWLNQENLEVTLKQQLLGEKNNKELLEDCFYKNLSFGTAGLRGELGFGTNRMNIYTVRKAALGLALYIKSCGEVAENRGVVIAYDPRHQSAEFGLEVTKVLGFNGIRCYLFDELQSTPLLSFAVRELNTFSGIVITASHNPSEYNGLKVYGEDGGQVTLEAANAITAHTESINNLFSVEVAEEAILLKEGLLTYLNHEMSDRYVLHLNGILLGGEPDKGLSIVYSPLHGAGSKLVSRGLEVAGFSDVTIVSEQAIPDPNFTTVKYPNPEESQAFEMALTYGHKVKADLLIATDPDADRMGVAVRDLEGEYVFLTGNQIGALLLNALLEDKSDRDTMPKNGVVLKTIVTSELGRAIADKYGVKMMDVLTGFKFISEKILEFEETAESTFLFGYEESYGYLIGDFVRDKDAVQASVLIAEVAARYKAKGQTLLDGLRELYKEHGFYQESLESITLRGKTGMAKIDEIVSYFRSTSFVKEFTKPLSIIEDYSSGHFVIVETGERRPLNLPIANALKFILSNGAWFAIRPSGTEPKIKFYFGVQGETQVESDEFLVALKAAVMTVVERLTIDLS
ncbi:phospho-sugar mutase [Sporosarcina psychrophila]|uniref:phospho-sugar mutase n=1 Tax=Sporosarcina psychrophila TaxID=1476 RepID=UPI00078CEF3D|nr:phospho-sugar mutase [Sporosarcina psychrophila]AMQ06223.1 phosphoglucomutase [Sporosarcina psychrophila]